ncbi:MAG: hypothetical protein PHQ61_08440 [Candidatus Omnitrophica bacterium]|nr:hypothetical protein [Candidatus Omnitrophota bacterium]
MKIKRNCGKTVLQVINVANAIAVIGSGFDISFPPKAEREIASTIYIRQLDTITTSLVSLPKDKYFAGISPSSAAATLIYHLTP